MMHDMTYQMSPTMGFLMLLGWLVFILAPLFMIWKRTGHSGWWSLLMFVPIVNFISLYVLAFKEWPILENNKKPESSND